MIDIRDLTLSYPGVTVLEVPELTVADGALTYLIGLNGTGKTTLLRCICGVISPTAGTVEVDGALVRAHQATPETLGMHLNYRAFDPRHTARRHLRWIARARGLSTDRVGEVLELVDLVRVADRRLGHYSLGMLQRVGIAAALLSEPRTLLLDEPLNGLDIAGIRWIRGLLRRLADAGTCVLVATHLLDEVERNADHIVVIGSQRILADQPFTHLMNTLGPGETSLEDAYLRIAGLTTDVAFGVAS
ncbi:ATP-binding cassette domain-containing protein [Nocardia brasiliensis]|uniref:ATP-binding cassette domain-containing protein n=1 Tax=Nocardia brasiliensis TaxID=37326 RepID=A0A6G9XZ02_NOCBR|nr:ATP-binding cassette domain-containing protein [Nocardia brasiliensis]QIS06154.1 ATP-binding cassette domain-containing protein [Nocardia brasiliensis]